MTRRPRIRRLLGAGLALLAVTQLASAQTPEPGLADKEAELTAIRRQIQAHRTRAEALQADEKGQLERLSELEKESALIEKLLEGLTARSEEIEQENAVLEAAIAEVESRVERRRQHLGQRLRAMYMRGDRSPLLYLVTSSSVTNMAARMRTITHVARAEKKLINDVLSDQRQLSRQRSELQRRLSEVHRNQSEAQDQRLHLERLQGERTDALTSLREERARFEASLRELEDSAQALENLLGSLDQGRTPADVGRPSSFAASKGALLWPLEGEILKPFGRARHPEFNTVVVNKGINIAASIGTPIRAVADGQVEYVHWLPGYGKCIIVNHGDGYFSLYAHASKIFPAVGAQIHGGEVLGEAGDTGSLNGSQLYFEIRQGREPMNPLEWLTRR